MSLWFGKGPQMVLEVGEEKGGWPVGRGEKLDYSGLYEPPLPPFTHPLSPTD